MVVTDVMLKNVCKVESGVCAECSIVIDDSLQIHNIRLIEGKNGLFLAFPHSKIEQYSKKYVDIVHPTNKNIRQYLTNVVISAYRKELNKSV